MTKELNLIIRLDETSVTITEVSRFSGKQEIESKSDHFFSSTQENDLKTELVKLLKSYSLNNNYDNILISWTNVNQFFVPMKLFQESNLIDIASLVFSSFEKNDLDYNRVPEINMVAIYKIPLWVKSSVITVFPIAEIKAEITYFVRSIFENSLYKPKLYLRLFPNCASFIIAGNSFNENSDLLFSNQYEYENEDDVVYYLMNILSNLKTANKPSALEIYLDENTKDFNLNKLNDFLNSSDLLSGIKIENKSAEELPKLYSKCV